MPRKRKVYSLLREEREEVQMFVEDQLRKGYIRPSKSPQVSPVHFVVKKDEDEEVLKKLVPRRFWKWKKVFGKKESERMPVRKIWDHTIELKEGFMPRKRKVYSLLREEREEVQMFVEDQLRKGYI